MVQVEERELKYEIRKAQDLPSLGPSFGAALGGKRRVEVEPPIQLEAVYFDTADHRLLRRGLTLRRRQGGGDDGWQLKVPTDRTATRLEVRRPLTASETGEVPEELMDLVFAVVRGAHLRPVATMQTLRSVTTVRGERDEELLEIAFDDVVGETLEGARRTWREIEVEIGSGGEPLARRVDKVLRHSGASRAAAPNKLASLFHLADERTAVRATKDPIANRLRALVDDAVLRDLELRQGGAEAVHDLRVDVRRLRSCLRTFSKSFRPRRCDWLADELHWLAGELGRVRDLEVQTRHLEREAMNRLGPARGAEVVVALEPLRVELTSAHADLADAMRSRRYARLLDELESFSQDPPYVSGRAPRERALLRAARAEEKKVRRRYRRAEKTPANERDVRLHATRKAAKRARYAAEAMTAIGHQRGERAAARYERVQELLGERQDAVVARQLLERCLNESHLGEVTAFGLGRLAAGEEQRQQEIDRAFERKAPKLLAS